MASQKPRWATWLHRSQVPPQRASQQTPSLQKPEAHSPSATQELPWTRLHTPPAQA
jgi:hypothetical protein